MRRARAVAGVLLVLLAGLLAGHDREFGAVGAPDSDELSDPAAHCDNADFLAGPYPQTRQQATDALIACVDHLRSRYRQAVDSAVGLITTTGRINRRR